MGLKEFQAIPESPSSNILVILYPNSSFPLDSVNELETSMYRSIFLLPSVGNLPGVLQHIQQTTMYHPLLFQRIDVVVNAFKIHSFSALVIQMLSHNRPVHYISRHSSYKHQ